MTRTVLFFLAGITMPACARELDVRCTGGSQLEDGVCRCPLGERRIDGECTEDEGSCDGSKQEGSRCEALDAGPEDDADEDSSEDEDSSAGDAEGTCPECDASPDASVEPDSGDSGEGDACLAVRWYADCDGDGYAVVGAETAMACDAPAAVGTCTAWTRTEPRAGATDCNDGDSSYRPSAGYGLAGDGDGDLNCDGTVQRDTVLHKFSLTPTGQGEVDICQSSSQCDCVFDVGGNLFDCSHHDRDWKRDFGRKSESCSSFVYQPTDVPRALGLQYCR